ncbi:MAG: Tetratricopeptide repeat protein [Methanoregulaceae archaeon PtaB.Bin056]|nr:MAG: Tetratricopeptide repeat protein [Methanoregulaceae archaeon PtaB.Bin056]
MGSSSAAQVLCTAYRQSWSAKIYYHGHSRGECQGDAGKAFPDREERGLYIMNRKVLQIAEKAGYYARLGMETAGAGNYAAALGYFDQALKEMPGHAAAWREKANCLDAMGRCEEAIRCFDQAIQIDPGDAESWFDKGLTLKKLGNEDEAFRCMSRGVDLELGV